MCNGRQAPITSIADFASRHRAKSGTLPAGGLVLAEIFPGTGEPMTFSVWLFIGIVAVLLGVLWVALKYSVKWFWGAIIIVFAALSIASVFQDNHLLWGLDSFPLDTDRPSGMSATFTVAYVSMLGSVGIMWFRAFLVRDIDRQSHRIALAFSLITVAAHVLIIGYLSLWNLWAAGDTGATLFSSVTWEIDSQSSSVRALTCLLIGLPLQHWFARKDPNVERNRWFVVTGGLIGLGSLTVIGHTAYQDPTWLSHGMDFLHGVGAALWFGGLIALVLYFRRAFVTREDAVEAGRVLAQFSTWALYSVIMLAFSGITIAVMVKDDAFSPTESPFAKALSVKLLIVIIPIALAAYNRFRLMPQLKADPQSPEAWTILRKTVFGELIAIIAILIVTGVLVLSSPAVS